MTWKPTFKLYASDGVTLVYEFEHVQNLPEWPYDEPSAIEITNLRSQGSINIPGGAKSYDINLQGILVAADYTALTTKIFSLQTTVLANTNYILRIDKSSSTHDDIHVIRKLNIHLDDSYRLTMQKYTVTFRALSW